MIFDAYAVVNPGAMVVVPLDTPVANVAVPASLSLNQAAVCTKLSRVELRNDIDKVNLWRRF